MIAQHFDNIWAYIDSITDINQAESSLKDGISKELVYNALTQRGIPTYDQFQDEGLYEYLIGDTNNGSFAYTSADGATMISASNNSSLPKGDITKEVWKRLYHNAPYLLKTKGTERGIKALMACYGVPESILHVKEYGGPQADKTGFRTFSYPKTSKMATHLDAATGAGTSDGIIRIVNFFVTSSYVDGIKYGRAVQTRILPDYNDDIIPIYNFKANTTDTDVLLFVSRSIDTSVVGDASASFGKLIIVTGSDNRAFNDDNVIFESNAVPFYNRGIWNISMVFNSGSEEGNDIQAYATQTTFHKNTYVAEVDIDGTNFFDGPNWEVLGSSPWLHIMPGDSKANLINRSSGSAIQEVRVWGEKLTKDTIVSQSLSPFNYNGNTISSSYDNLLIRFPLGSDLSTDGEKVAFIPSGSFNKAPNCNHWAYQKFLGSFDVPLYLGNFIEVSETHHLTTPDTVGSSMVSNKVRIDKGTVDNNWLSPFSSTETSTQDRQPLDYSDLGVFFSPTFEINEDIIYTLGGFRLDDYIGDPTHYTSGSYPDLKELQYTYNRKTDKRFNFYDYIRMIRDFAPAKANLKTGLVIEPHYLERIKHKGLNIDYTQEKIHVAQYAGTGSISSTNETEHLINIDVESYLDGSEGIVENNATNSVLSKKLTLI